jgi:hypothetical protein
VPSEYEHSSFKNRGSSDVLQDIAWQFMQKWHQQLDICIKYNVKFKMKGANVSGIFAFYSF